MAKRKKSTEDQSTENTENINDSDDNFGLPEIEYEPINREAKPQEDIRQEEEAAAESSVEEESAVEMTSEPEIEVENHHHEEHVYNPIEEDESSSAPRVIGIIVVIIVLALGGWYFLKYRPAQQKIAAEKAKQEEAARLAEKVKEDARQAEIKRVADEQRRADSLANAKPVIGTIETLTERTRRYYVVVASAIDDDLIHDYANDLSKKGVSSKIIPPFGKTKFFRIAVTDKDTFAEAQTTADELKSQYGDGAWVVKY